ncbi:hypothetical protein ACOSP7_010642 [Xanthoceras sorbifolium]
MVSFLKTVTGSWDSELVHCSFHADEADAILSILSTCHFVADSICWHYDSRGLFSVKNGYRIAISSADKPSGSLTSSTSAWWRSLWWLGIPPKVKLFL